MIRLRQIKLSINDDTELLRKNCAKKLKVADRDIISIKINKRSIDARYKPDLYYIYEVDVKINNEDKILKSINNKDIFKVVDEKYEIDKLKNTNSNAKIVIVGSGPAGLFCAYVLSLAGIKPTIIERGEQVEKRIKTVDEFWKNGNLNTESNVQFGEGGAGTFSDGKLNTLVKDKFNRSKFILETFVKFGANEDILYDSKPHIGTDVLRKVIINMRKSIISLGGSFKFNTKLTNINIINNNIKSIEVNDNEIIACDNLILALGHSARDTFKMLYDKKIEMESKPFAVGVRIQHPQEMINLNQYGRNNFNNASYKLTYKTNSGRGVYSFCMCPGGFVVNASSEQNMIAINGMSNYKRDEENANSAIVVTVNKSDFGDNVFDGMKFQRNLESLVYKHGKGNVPIQLYKDFKNNKISTYFGNVSNVMKGKFNFANINDILPKSICDALKEGIDYFDTKIKGFSSDDAILAAVESRTSSPVRIIRDENFESNIKGIYPIGEGAGYAGGIMSAAIDGMKIAESIIKRSNN